MGEMMGKDGRLMSEGRARASAGCASRCNANVPESLCSQPPKLHHTRLLFIRLRLFAHV